MRLLLVLALAVAGCASGGSTMDGSDSSGAGDTDLAGPENNDGRDGAASEDLLAPVGDAATSSRRGFPSAAPWVSFYGGAGGVDLAKAASTFRIINIDADPAAGNFTNADIATLRGGGKNRVISYLNVGACEDFRDYWPQCQSSGALTTAYCGYQKEKWANLAVVAYRDLLVNTVAPRLAATGVDGFFLDNLEVIEHGPSGVSDCAPNEGPCDAKCVQGGLDLVWELRQKFPNLLIVMQNATSDVTLHGTTHGVSLPSLLDGVSHEDTYGTLASGDSQFHDELLSWKAQKRVVGGRPFWIGSEDYVGGCTPKEKGLSDPLYAQAAGDGISEYVTDSSSKQQAPCYW